LWNRILDVDSTIDAGFYGLTQWVSDRWTAYSVLVDRMRIAGVRRVFIDIASDSLTYATVAGLILYAWALPETPPEDELRAGARQYSVVFTDRNGRYIGRRGVRHNDAVGLDEIPVNLINAVLATEDERFYQHFGVDVVGTLRAMFENVKANDIVQGGSSLTQQVAKNLFLTPDQTIERKVKEAFLALWIEARLTKREILKLYLDRAYMGAGAYGIEGAAEFYFGKSVRDVSLAESAMLAGLFKAPSRFAPHRNLPAARERANIVLARMVESGFITEGQARVARINPARLVEAADIYAPEHFLDWAFEEAQRLAAGRAHVLSVRTTLDLSMQQHGEEAVLAALREHGQARNIGDAALVSMSIDGAVRALVGGKDYGESQFNRVVNAKRQPGSSWKPFVYLAALKNGFTPKSVVVDAPICLRGWCPRNYGRSYRGSVSLTTALQKSINTIPVRLAQSIGRQAIADTAHDVGINTELRLNLSMPLGTNEVTLLDMTGAYATFASDGIKTTPYAITEIRTQTGDPIYRHDSDAPPRRQVADPEKVEQLNMMLNQVVVGGTGRRANLDFTPVAGKTGTNQAYRDAWFIAYTGELSTGVWMGNDDFMPTDRVTGGSIPAQVWHDYMMQAISERYAVPIPGVELYGTPKPVESEADKERKIVQAAVDRAVLDRKIEFLDSLGGLFQRGLLGPIRSAGGGGVERAGASDAAGGRREAIVLPASAEPGQGVSP
jgi:penicillin-binding protein 1A